jgi:penicillin-binding protein 2
MVSNPAHLKLVQRGLEAVLHGPTGTARAVAQGANYRMAGKTGTAQRVSRNRDSEVQRTLGAGQKNQALFIGYAPVESPRIAIAVVVEQGGSGSQAAAPVARAIFDAWLLGGDAGTSEALSETVVLANPDDAREGDGTRDPGPGNQDAQAPPARGEAVVPANPDGASEEDGTRDPGTGSQEAQAPPASGESVVPANPDDSSADDPDLASRDPGPGSRAPSLATPHSP